MANELDEEQITDGRVLSKATQRKLSESVRRTHAIGGEVYSSGNVYFYDRNDYSAYLLLINQKPHRGGTFCFIRPGDALKRIEKFIAHDEMLLGGRPTNETEESAVD